MKDIKFRGKQIDSGEWAYGLPSYDTFGKITEIEIWEDCGETMEFYSIDPSTVGQYTGLQDKDGREVYEGDIVQNIYGDIFTVEYYGEHWYGYVLTASDGCVDHLYEYDEYEIIGNVHDNPKPLKGDTP